jgi:prolyl-tRNA synthetase
MSDGKALQMGTSHNLGQHFAQVFNIRFEDRGRTCNMSGRLPGRFDPLIGALVMAHGDVPDWFSHQGGPLQVVIIRFLLAMERKCFAGGIELKNRLERAGLRVFLMTAASIPQAEFSDGKCGEFPCGWK